MSLSKHPSDVCFGTLKIFDRPGSAGGTLVMTGKISTTRQSKSLWSADGEVVISRGVTTAFPNLRDNSQSVGPFGTETVHPVDLDSSSFLFGTLIKFRTGTRLDHVVNQSPTDSILQLSDQSVAQLYSSHIDAMVALIPKYRTAKLTSGETTSSSSPRVKYGLHSVPFQSAISWLALRASR